MLKFLRPLYTLHYPYRDPFERQKAQDLLWLLIAIGVIGITNFFLGLVLGFSLLFLAPLTIVVVTSSVYAGFQVQLGRLRLATYVLILLLFFVPTSQILGGINNLGFLTFVLPLTLAGILLRGWETLLLLGAVTLVLIVSVTNSTSLTLDLVNNRITFFATVSLILTLTTLILVLLAGNTQRTAERVAHDMQQFRALAETDIFDKFEQREEELLLATLNFLRAALNFDIVQLYMMDDAGKEARRIYSGFGLDKLQYGERVSLNAASGVGEAMRARATLVVNAESNLTRKRALSAGMKQAILVPLLADNKLLGILDVQTNRDEPFSDSQIETVETYARHLVSALQRERIIRQLRDDLREQERIIIKQRQQLRELEQARPTALTSSWQDFFQQYTNRLMGFDVDMRQARATPASELDEDLRAALAAGDIVIREVDNRQHVSLPIMLRDELLGAMSFQLAPNVTLTERQTELIRSVVQRLALALENKRLFEQSQTQAERESTANAAASVLLTTTDIETVLELAAQLFNNSLGAVKTQIYLQPPLLQTTQETTS